MTSFTVTCYDGQSVIAQYDADFDYDAATVLDELYEAADANHLNEIYSDLRYTVVPA